MIDSGTGNRVLDEILNISPPAKAALLDAHTRLAGSQPQPQPGQPAPATQPQAQPAQPAMRMPVPGQAQVAPIMSAAKPAQPQPQLQAQAPAMTMPVPQQQHVAELNRLTTGNTGKPGIDQIKNPWARIPLQIADAVGSGLFPKIAMNVPGMTAHHNMLVNQAQQNVGEDEAQAQSAAKVQQDQALTNEANARAQAVVNPPNRFTPLSTTNGYVMASEKDGTAQPLMVNGQQAQPLEKATPPHFTTMPDGSVVGINTDPATGEMKASVVYKGDPKVETELADLQVNGKPHKVIVNKQTGAVIHDLGESGVKPPSVNVNENHEFQLNERGRGLLDKAEQTYRTAAQSADDLIGMIDMARAGNKVAAQASPLEGTLSIVTSQGVKRINRTEVEGIQGAGSLFDKLTGEVGKLTVGQPLPANIQDDFQKLAGMLKSNAYKSYRDAFDSTTKRYKLTDEQPLPEPRGGGGGNQQQPKTASMADVQAYAKANGMTVDAAKQAFASEGFQVQ